VAFATGLVPVLGELWQQPSQEEKVYEWSYFAPTESEEMLAERGVFVTCVDSCLSSEWAGFGK
jgi:hypothetical protein